MIGLLFVAALSALPKHVQGGPDGEGDETDSILLREATSRRISWQTEGRPIEQEIILVSS